MKVIMVEMTSDGGFAASVGVDSAVLRAGEPVFVPEPAVDWCSRIIPALRISRLGLHISVKNACRHYDSVSLFHVLTPATPVPGIPDGLIDRTFSPGIWLPLAENGSEYAFGVSRGPIGGAADFTARGTFSVAGNGADAAVARLSEVCTLRTGDVLLFADAAVSLGSPLADTCVQARLNDERILNIRIK